VVVATGLTASANQLGEALRSARLQHRPPLTLTALGTHPDAPRAWSHAHLSKVERGLELPKPELVAWYETCTGTPTGVLLDLLTLAHEATNDEAAVVTPSAPTEWILERLELHANFRSYRPGVTRYLDMVATVDDLQEYHFLVDDAHQEPVLPEVLSGGRAPTVTWRSGHVAQLSIALHRAFDKGEWHRLRVREALNEFSRSRQWVSAMVRGPHTREAVVSVCLPDGVRVEPWLFGHADGLALGAVFGPGADRELDPRDVLDDAVPARIEADGRVRTRFRSLEPGAHYGIGWRFLET
jgi:hypothetical protein